MSVMRDSLIGLMDKFGIGDIVLPFLLVFTIVFAILEKTKVFGVDKIGNQVYTRKNLNAMTAFVVAFFVVMSNQLVKVIMKTTSDAVLLLLLSILFLMLVGSFQEESDKGVSLSGGWAKLFMGIMFVGIVVIFLDSLKTPSGQTWLAFIWNGIGGMFTSEFFEGLTFLAVIVGALYFIVKDDHPASNSGDSDNNS